MVSPGLAEVVSAVTLSSTGVAANTGTAVASIVKSITKLSTIDVIRLFMTKFLLKEYICGTSLTHRLRGLA